MRGGYFRVYRELFEPRNEPTCERFAWLDMVSMARFEDGDGLKRSELRGSARTFAKRWGWSRAKADRFLRKARDAKRVAIETQGGTQASVITICDYDTYSPLVAKGETQGETQSRRNVRQEEVNNKEEVKQIVDFYLQTFPNKRKISPSVKAKVGARLTDNYSVEDIKHAILGNAGSQFHRDNGHDSLELIVRNCEKLDMFIAKYSGSKQEDMPLLNAAPK